MMALDYKKAGRQKSHKNGFGGTATGKRRRRVKT